MNEFSSHLVDGLLTLETTVGASITWAGQVFPCVAGAIMGGRILGLGGFTLNADTTIVLRFALFDPTVGLPAEKQTLSYTSEPNAPARQLRIDKATPWQDALLVLECNDPNRGS